MKKGVRFGRLVGKEEALLKAKRDPSSSLVSLVERKERTEVVADSNNEGD